MSTTFIISDLHLPFQHQDAIPFILACLDRYCPDDIVDIGDMYDMHALSQWDSDPDGLSASGELERAIEAAQPLYDNILELKSCEGNHEIRYLRAALKHGIPQKFMRNLNDIVEAPSGWQRDTRWEIDNVIYEHGVRFGGIIPHLRHAENNFKSTVIGHWHSVSGIEYFANKTDLIFGMAVGCLIDWDSYAFKYALQARLKQILSCGLVRDGVPMLIPMQLDIDGRWTRRLP